MAAEDAAVFFGVAFLLGRTIVTAGIMESSDAVLGVATGEEASFFFVLSVASECGLVAGVFDDDAGFFVAAVLLPLPFFFSFLVGVAPTDCVALVEGFRRREAAGDRVVIPTLFAAASVLGYSICWCSTHS